MRRLIAVLSLSALAFAVDASADEVSVCSGLRAHHEDTVIVLSPPAELTICRRGYAQRDIVTGRPVWLMLRPSKTPTLYEYRLHGRDEEPAASGLAVWQERASSLAEALRALSESAQPIGELPPAMPPSSDPAQRSVLTARGLYLGVATPMFHEMLRAISSELTDVSAVADALKRWSDRLATEAALPAELQSAVHDVCAGPALFGGAAQRGAAELRKAIDEYHARRTDARDALVVAEASPTDRAAQEAAARALDTARTAARSVVAHAAALAPIVRRLAEVARIEREAAHSGGLLRAGVPVYLARYSHAGNGVLQIDVRPQGLIAEGVSAANADTHTITFRFSIVASHYIDLEIGLGITGGVPAVPSLGTVNGMAVLQGRAVDEFVALGFVELEPLRFVWPDREWAGLLRFPVLGIPLSRDPTQNFFFGAGLGWTGVGSITVGPYLLRELTLRSGFSFDTPLPIGASFSAATQPSVQVGYFVAASVDLVGLFHLFVPVHLHTVDASTGKEL